MPELNPEVNSFLSSLAEELDQRLNALVNPGEFALGFVLVVIPKAKAPDGVILANMPAPYAHMALKEAAEQLALTAVLEQNKPLN